MGWHSGGAWSVVVIPSHTSKATQVPVVISSSISANLGITPCHVNFSPFSIVVTTIIITIAATGSRGGWCRRNNSNSNRISEIVHQHKRDRQTVQLRHHADAGNSKIFRRKAPSVQTWGCPGVPS